MTTIESALDRIKKLLAHSESARGLGSVAEAEAFAAKAADIALQHKLSLDAIEFADEVSADPIDTEWANTADLAGFKRTRSRSAWQQTLLSVIARNHSVRFLVVAGSKTVQLVGTSADRAIVKYLYAVLAKEAERLAVAHSRAEAKRAKAQWLQSWERPEGVKRSFLLGFVDGIRQKLALQRKAAFAEAGQYAVVRVQTHDEAVQKAADDLSEGRSPNLNRSIKHGASYNSGKQAGMNANTNSGLGGGTTSRASSMRLTA